MSNVDIVMYSLMGGIFPAIGWLLFWLREDALKPEPRIMIMRTFLFGMLAVVAVIPIQRFIAIHYEINDPFDYTLMAIILWAVFEEAFKFAAAYIGGLASRDDDEPIDPLIYLITAALGFVALENALFILKSLRFDSIAGSIIAGNMRFIGPSLLHTVSSATIGLALAFSFYKPFKSRLLWGVLGFILATVFHVIFNVAMLNENQIGTFLSFSTVWAGITILLLFFEKIKLIRSPSVSTKKTSLPECSHDTI